MIVYKVTNKINGKLYIGQTTMKLERRWYYHCHKLSGCRFLHNAIQKYGAENFIVEQIDVACSKQELDEKEKQWIEFYNCIVPNGYNLKTGGNKPTYSDESREKMSRNHADVSGERNPRYGATLSDETKAKIRNSSVGKTLSEETKSKIISNSKLRKPVINLDTKEIFLSSRQAEKAYNLPHGTISRVCRGEGKTSAGFRWKYESEVN